MVKIRVEEPGPVTFVCSARMWIWPDVVNGSETHARILKSARTTEMRITESIRKICGQKTETKEKEGRCLTLSRILGSA